MIKYLFDFRYYFCFTSLKKLLKVLILLLFTIYIIKIKQDFSIEKVNFLIDWLKIILIFNKFKFDNLIISK